MTSTLAEKQEPLLPVGVYHSSLNSPVQPSKTRFVAKVCIVLGLYAAIRARTSVYLVSIHYGSLEKHKDNGLRCSQAALVLPETHRTLWDSLNTKIGEPEFKQAAVDWLAGAVRVP